jgi:hypothetical protein
MKKIDEAIDRIRILECPTGELENRVTQILEDYRISSRSKINVNRDNKFDSNEAQAYRVEIEGEDQSIMVLAKSAYDDYVATVIDAYTN